MSNILLYSVTAILLLLSFFKDRAKTAASLKKAWRSFENILPEFLVVILFVGILLAVLNPEVISKIIGEESGWLGVVTSAIIGAVTLIPGFVAFPTAAMLFENGAGLIQVGAFVSTLMMVGVVTIPVEKKYFGKKVTFIRNTSAFVFSFIVAAVIGLVVK